MKKTNLTSMRIEGYQGNFNKNYDILSNGGAVRITHVVGSGKWSSYYTCQFPHSVSGYDIVVMNDAPRGGQLGNYVAATKFGDKTIERAEFVKRFRKIWKTKLEREFCNSNEFIKRAAKEAVNIVGRRMFENYGLTEEQFLKSTYNDGTGLKGFHAQQDDGYRGCGVYRVAIKDGKIVATVYGGYHNSCPYLVDIQKWIPAISAELSQYGEVVKADGSCCSFFLREIPITESIQVKEYDVPAPYGNGNLGFMHHNIEVV